MVWGLCDNCTEIIVLPRLGEARCSHCGGRAEGYLSRGAAEVRRQELLGQAYERGRRFQRLVNDAPVPPFRPPQPSTQQESPVLLVKEVMTYFKITRQRVFGLLKAGDLERGRRLGRATVITRASVEKLEARLTGNGPRVSAPNPRERAVAPTDAELRAQRKRLFARPDPASS